MTVMEDAKKVKEEGNEHFKQARYQDALKCYSKALSLSPSTDSADAATYLKNRAACFLKLEKYQEAVNDCTAVLEICPSDSKALFRRSQAYENMEKFEEAYRDGLELLRVDPKNKAIQPLMLRLNPIIQQKINQRGTTEDKVAQMFDLTFKDTAGDAEKRKQAANNLIVLARDNAGAEKIFKSDGVQKINFLLDTEQDKELKLTAIRVLACLAHNNRDRSMGIIEEVSRKKILAYIGSEDEPISTAMAHVLQNVLNSVTGLEELKKEREKYEMERKADVGSKSRPFPFLSEKIGEEGKLMVDTIFPMVVAMLNSAKVSGCGRDNVIELLIKFISRADGVGWPKKFVEGDGIQHLLEVAGSIPEHKLLPLTQNTKMHTSLLLSKIWDDLHSDGERDVYRKAVDTFFDDLFTDQLMDSKIEAVLALASLLQGPMEVGNSILGRSGILELILALADSDNAIHTKYAVEALVHSASKKDKCSGVIKQATPILKQLYQSQSDTIKVRALVGLCKLGSFGGGDVTAKSFADGSTVTLAKACRKFLCNPAKDVDLKKWAAEGLAYLSLDADIKEDIVEDKDAVIALIELAKVPDKGTVYPVAQILVNITNSYEKKEPEAEMLELAKFAKHHIPEEHEKDKEPHISNRVKKLMEAGVVNALVALSKTESESSREMLARVYLAVCADKEHRGLVVQQGGAKALIPLALDGTTKGKVHAAHALAKIAVTNNPEIAFPGERAYEVIRPLLSLLKLENTALENFEALLGLTNLASMNERARQRIVKEKGMPMIEYYCFEEHEQLRRASVECMCNLVMTDEAAKCFKGDNDRLKLFLLYCGEEDISLVMAAAGAIAQLTSLYDQELCAKLTTCTEQWHELLSLLCAHEHPGVQHRATYIVNNMMHADKDIAERIVQSSLLEVLMAVSKMPDDPAKASAKDCAKKALAKAVGWGLIKPTADMVAAEAES